MKPIEFFVVVKKMRELQKAFFAMSSANPQRTIILNECKRLEGIIDREIQYATSRTEASKLAAAWKPYDISSITQQTLSL